MTPEERLKQVKHIVVLMMENRSFDHMLGYLKMDGLDEVDGLTGNEFNRDANGKKHPVHAFDTRRKDVQREGEPLEKRLDPDHSRTGVERQIGPSRGKAGFDMDGFVKDYVASRKDKKGKTDTTFPRELWSVPMGFYEAKDLPVYDLLARNYCVCDAWHSSVPGDTWPNRQYAVAGQAGPSVWKESELFQRVKNIPPFKQLGRLPLFDVPAFTRQLEDDDWRWYSHDPATLRLVDEEYRDLEKLRENNFAWFDRKDTSRFTHWVEEDLLDIISADSFIDDATKGQLRKVSWIDPNFFDAHVLDPHSNDDHPPSDVVAGQHLAFEVYDALMTSEDWEDTVLVITYDEHGGFYDHVKPPAVRDNPPYKRLGVRVPALIVGPRVRRQVMHKAPGKEPWDHTALIRSILLAFADDPQAAIDEMGGRVRERKAHLGMMLADEPRDDIPPLDPDLKRRMRHWREDARGYRSPRVLAEEVTAPSKAPDGAGQPLVLTEFQNEWLQYKLAMRKAGLTGT